jgi:hypothetical protein
MTECSCVEVSSLYIRAARSEAYGDASKCARKHICSEGEVGR